MRRIAPNAVSGLTRRRAKPGTVETESPPAALVLAGKVTQHGGHVRRTDTGRLPRLRIASNFAITSATVGSAKLRPGAAGRDPAALEQPDTLVIGVRGYVHSRPQFWHLRFGRSATLAFKSRAHLGQWLSTFSNPSRTRLAQRLQSWSRLNVPPRFHRDPPAFTPQTVRPSDPSRW